MKFKPMLIGGVAVVVLAGAWLWHEQWQSARRTAALRVLVRGGDAGGLPLAPPADEHFNADELARASRDSAAAQLSAFIVMRHGHVVFEQFGHGFNANSMVDSGPFARVLVALLAGVAVNEGALDPRTLTGFDPEQVRVAIENGSHQSYADYLSSKLWRRLNAAAAWIVLPAAGAPAPASCCFEARVQDWMRVAGLLIGDGSFEGTRVVPKGWVARMRLPVSGDGRSGFGIELPAAVQGFEPFAIRDIFFVRGSGHWRLWLAPALQLAVLFGSTAPQPTVSTATAAARPETLGGSSWDETRLPNLVIGALTDLNSSDKAETLLQRLVPGH